MTNTLASPSKKLKFIGGNPNSKHIVYDAVSSETLDAFEAVYGERALVDYDFSKLHLLFLWEIFLVTGKVEVMIRDILKEEFLKTERCHALSIRGEYDAVWCGC
jgi:hypothetical protein